MGLLDRYATSKRKWQVSSSGELDNALVQSAESSQPAANDHPAADGSSGDQVFTIPGSPGLGPVSGAEPDRVGRSESNEGDPAPRALQVILLSDRGEEKPRKSKYMRSGLPKLNRPDQVITINTFLPTSRSLREWRYQPLGWRR